MRKGTLCRLLFTALYFTGLGGGLNWRMADRDISWGRRGRREEGEEGGGGERERGGGGRGELNCFLSPCCRDGYNIPQIEFARTDIQLGLPSQPI